MRRVDAVADGAPSADTVPSGFPSVDRMLGGGVRRGDLVVLGGDVGSGKSALLLALALRMSAHATVVLWSGEMTVDRVLERALAVEGRVPVDALRSGELDDMQRATVGAAAHRLRARAPLVLTIGREGVAGLARFLRDSEDRPAVVMVDPMAALSLESRLDDALMAQIVTDLKRLALEFDVCVVASSPLPRFDPRRHDRRPTLDDLGAAGAIKDTADVVLALYREGMYDPGLGIDGATELLVRKHRNGATGYADLYFFEQWMRFEDLMDPDC